jgi:hypothetical protein
MNLDPTNSIHISFSGAATANHLEIAAGQMYQFPPSAAFTGVISAIAIGASVIVAVEEFLGS